MFADLTRRFEEVSYRYAETHGLTRDADWFLLKLLEEAGELTQAANRLSGRGRPKGRTPEEVHESLADETADLLGHLLLFAHFHGVDLEAAIARKWRFSPR